MRDIYTWQRQSMLHRDYDIKASRKMTDCDSVSQSSTKASSWRKCQGKPAYKNVSPEAQEHQTLEAAAKQRHWEH
jgi:hypothetical protein